MQIIDFVTDRAIAKWLWLFISNNWPLTAVGSAGLWMVGGYTRVPGILLEQVPGNIPPPITAAVDI